MGIQRYYKGSQTATNLLVLTKVFGCKLFEKVIGRMRSNYDLMLSLAVVTSFCSPHSSVITLASHRLMVLSASPSPAQFNLGAYSPLQQTCSSITCTSPPPFVSPYTSATSSLCCPFTSHTSILIVLCDLTIFPSLNFCCRLFLHSLPHLLRVLSLSLPPQLSHFQSLASTVVMSLTPCPPYHLPILFHSLPKRESL